MPKASTVGFTKQLYNQFFHPWRNIQVGAIVSTGRTGTNFFGSFFNDHFQDVYSVHEPVPDLMDFGVEQVYHKKIPFDDAVAGFLQLRRKMLLQLKEKQVKYYVESNPYLSLFTHIIQEAMPHLKIIHLVRDPKSYVVSSYNYKPPAGGGKYGAYSKNDPRRRLAATDFPDDPWYNYWNEFSRFDKICWHWYKYNQLILDNAPADNSYLLLRFEDVFNSDSSASCIQQIVAFLGLKLKPGVSMDAILSTLQERKNVSQKTELTSYDDWTAEQKIRFNEITGKLASQFGYTTFDID